MFRYIAILPAATLMLCTFSYSANADEYGERFYNQTPVGMADYTVPEQQMIAMDDVATQMQDIMPAAGEERTEGSEEAANQENPSEDQQEEQAQ